MTSYETQVGNSDNNVNIETSTQHYLKICQFDDYTLRDDGGTGFSLLSVTHSCFCKSRTLYVDGKNIAINKHTAIPNRSQGVSSSI